MPYLTPETERLLLTQFFGTGPLRMPPRLAPELRHAQHVKQPHPECEVCRAKGRV